MTVLLAVVTLAGSIALHVRHQRRLARWDRVARLRRLRG